MGGEFGRPAPKEEFELPEAMKPFMQPNHMFRIGEDE
jgi:hypothetical protein